jgi:nucleotide-binding universal stress UspA family protein
MLEIRRILFPVDFSQRCSAAASHVAAMTRQFHAKVTLLHVIRTPRAWQDDLASAELDATPRSSWSAVCARVPQRLFVRRPAWWCACEGESLSATS